MLLLTGIRLLQGHPHAELFLQPGPSVKIGGSRGSGGGSDCRALPYWIRQRAELAMLQPYIARIQQPGGAVGARHGPLRGTHALKIEYSLWGHSMQ